MIDANEIRPGTFVVHPGRNKVYLIVSIGKVKWVDGEWYDCARYTEYNKAWGGPEYFRRTVDFKNFELNIEGEK